MAMTVPLVYFLNKNIKNMILVKLEKWIRISSLKQLLFITYYENETIRKLIKKTDVSSKSLSFIKLRNFDVSGDKKFKYLYLCKLTLKNHE